MSDFSLIETMRWEPETGIIRLRLHLARLTRSAGRLGFLGADRAAEKLSEVLGEIHPARSLFSPAGRSAEQSEAMRGPSGTFSTSRSPSSGPSGHLLPTGEKKEQRPGPLRVRLTLSPAGEIAITTAPFAPLPPDTIWRVAIAAARLDSTNRLLRHKTTRREIYEAARAEYPAADADEVLLLNEKGEPCEGTITSIFLDDGSGMLKTPPVACGLLAGVLRTELICARRARVQRLTLADLKTGTLYMGNSLRGLIRAKLLMKG
ncbi:aminotransferase class IV family protein [Pararhizobium sp.]|uniref:aminotransferase class IV family protein n=1 Tax=Pararhizobium sp. TaxID=1977563 RepID=UPI003BABA455